MRNLLLAVALLLPIAAQATPCEGTPGEQQVTVQLFFGRAHKDGSQINPAEWADYVARDVTPRFSTLTVIDATSQAPNAKTGRLLREKSTIIEIVTTPSPESWTRLQALRDAYIKRFGQDSVGMVANLSCASW